jgi:hypothetical protein
VEIVILSMDGGGGPENTRRMAQNAAENGCWVIIANTWSCAILSPNGEIRLEKYEAEQVTIGRVLLSEVPRGPDRRSMLGRRTDLYGPLLESIEPDRWYDKRGYPTEWAEQKRAELQADINSSAEDESG